MTPLHQWLETLIRSLSTYPEAVIITEKQDDMGTHYIISTHQADRGIMIGRKGDHVNALRVLLRAQGVKHGTRATLQIISE